MWLLWNLFDLAGTLSFAVSGAIVGAVKRMDIFGISVLAILTAVGGGMIRDVLSGHIPPAALRNPVPHRTGPIGCYCNQLLYLFVPFGGPEKKVPQSSLYCC